MALPSQTTSGRFVLQNDQGLVGRHTVCERVAFVVFVQTGSRWTPLTSVRRTSGPRSHSYHGGASSSRIQSGNLPPAWQTESDLRSPRLGPFRHGRLNTGVGEQPVVSNHSVVLPRLVARLAAPQSAGSVVHDETGPGQTGHLPSASKYFAFIRSCCFKCCWWNY